MINNQILLDPQIGKNSSAQELVSTLAQHGVKYVRMLFSDLHGYARGKDIPLDFLESAIKSGQSFCVANMNQGLASNTSNDKGYPDMRAFPDVSTLVTLPWEAHTVQCLLDLYDHKGNELDISPRQLLKKVTELFENNLRVKPIVAHELEFFLLRKTPEGGWKKYNDQLSMVYTVGRQADELGILHTMLDAGKTLGLGVTVANHEFGGGQFEINMVHGEAAQTADRAFLFKNMVKEIAACHGLLATFMGKPFTDDTGSGYHLHISLVDEDDKNIFQDTLTEDGLSAVSKHFIAGVLHHAPALMAFLAPTINAYKRLVPDSLVPLNANWGYDNRTTFIRVPDERGSASRIEIRVGDAAANPYLISAVCLLAGYDGIVNKLEPPAFAVGDVSVGDIPGTPLPRSMEESLAALRANPVLAELIGQPLVETYCAMKQVELDRYRRHVTDWEFNEYVFHL